DHAISMNSRPGRAGIAPADNRPNCVRGLVAGAIFCPFRPPWPRPESGRNYRRRAKVSARTGEAFTGAGGLPLRATELIDTVNHALTFPFHYPCRVKSHAGDAPHDPGSDQG